MSDISLFTLCSGCVYKLKTGINYACQTCVNYPGIRIILYQFLVLLISMMMRGWKNLKKEQSLASKLEELNGPVVN